MIAYPARSAPSQARKKPFGLNRPISRLAACRVSHPACSSPVSFALAPQDSRYMNPTSWFSSRKFRNSAVSRSSARQASRMNSPSPEARYSCHISPGQNPPVHQPFPA